VSLLLGTRVPLSHCQRAQIPAIRLVLPDGRSRRDKACQCDSAEITSFHGKNVKHVIRDRRSLHRMSSSVTGQILHSAISHWQAVGAISLLAVLIHQFVIYPFFTSPLARIPGPKINALTKWYMVYIDFSKKHSLYVHDLHQKYWPLVRIGPNEVVCTGEEPMKTIYGAGTAFYKPRFYDLFMTYIPPQHIQLQIRRPSNVRHAQQD
jgi:hypothetical protein